MFNGSDQAVFSITHKPCETSPPVTKHCGQWGNSNRLLEDHQSKALLSCNNKVGTHPHSVILPQHPSVLICSQNSTFLHPFSKHKAQLLREDFRQTELCNKTKLLSQVGLCFLPHAEMKTSCLLAFPFGMNYPCRPCAASSGLLTVSLSSAPPGTNLFRHWTVILLCCLRSFVALHVALGSKSLSQCRKRHRQSVQRTCC